MVIPDLTTERLLLRPFVSADAVTVQRLVGERDVASTIDGIAHPYPDGAAAAWIASHDQQARAGTDYTWAITDRRDAVLLGAVTLRLEAAHRRGVIGYWVGLPWWSQGFTTEAAGCVVAYAFDSLDLHRLQAVCLPTNIGSVRVLEKLGFRREGLLRDYVLKWGEFQDRAMYRLLDDEWSDHSDS